MKTANIFRQKVHFWALGLIVLSIVYWVVLFDSHALWLLESLGSRFNGAQIEAHSFKVSLWRGTFQINQLQIANPFNPSQNLVQFDRITGRVLISPLLRRKLVVESVQFEGARFGLDRQHYGGLATSAEESSGVLDRAAAGFSSPILSRISQNPLRLLGQLETSIEFKSKLSELVSNLSSLRRLDELKTDIDAISKLKGGLFADADSYKKINALSERFEKLRVSRTPSSVAVNPWTTLHVDASSAVKPLISTQEQVNARLDRVRKSLWNLEPYLLEDVQNLRNRLRLPNLNSEDLSTEIFGPRIFLGLDRIAYWLDVGRRRMPNGTPEIVRQNRARGEVIYFGKDGGWPAVLIKKITFVAAASNESLSGTITGVTTEPPSLHSPCVVDLTINSALSSISNLHIHVVIDHQTEVPSESIEVTADGLPIGPVSLSEGHDLKFQIDSATLKGNLKIRIQGDKIQMSWDTVLDQAKYSVSSRHRQIQETLTNASLPLSTFNLSGKAEGPFNDIQFTMRSELGKSIAETVFSTYKHPVAAINETLKTHVMDVTSPRQKSLDFELDSLDRAISSEFDTRISTLNHIAATALVRSKKRLP